MATPRADKQNPQAPARSPVTGQFLPGNRFNRQVSELRQALVAAVTPTNMKEITQMLIFRAEGRNLQAIRMVYQWVLGKPAPIPQPDRQDVEEWELAKCRPSQEEVEEVCKRVPVATAVAMTRGPVEKWMEEGCARVEALEGQVAGNGRMRQEIEFHRSGDAGKRTTKPDVAARDCCTEAPRDAG